MKRSPVTALSRLTLKLPGWSTPHSWDYLLYSKLKLEELEGRENPAPVVTAPTFSGGFATISENGSFVFETSEPDDTGFSLSESGCVTMPPYTADITVTNGTLTIDAATAACMGLGVTGNGTSALSVTGDINDVNILIRFHGFVYTPTAYWSGTEHVNITLTDNASNSSSASATLFVSPVADPPNVSSWNLEGSFVSDGDGDYIAPLFNLPFTASTANDNDGSESLSHAYIFEPYSFFGDNFIYDPSLYGSDVYETFGAVRVNAAVLDTFQFHGEAFLESSVWHFGFQVDTTDSAIDPNGNVVVASAAYAGSFTVTYNPTIELDNLLPEVDESQTGSDGIPVQPVLHDPTWSGSTSPHTLTLTGTHGIFTTLDPSVGGYTSLTVTGSSTDTVTISGDFNEIQNYLDAASVYFWRSQYYSGYNTISANLDAPLDDFYSGGGCLSALAALGSGRNAYASMNVNVNPVPSNPSLFMSDRLEETGPVYFYYSNQLDYWPDTDGSETVEYSYSITGVADPSQFQLNNYYGDALTYNSSTNTWSTGIAYGDWFSVQDSLNALELIPPSGFLGDLTLTLNVTVHDRALIGGSEGDWVTNSRTISGTATITLVSPPAVSLPTVAGTEGQPVDLGGKYVVSDAAGQSWYQYFVTFSAPAGVLSFNPALLGEGTADVFQNRDGSITVYGTLDQINTFLATPGCLVYQPIGPAWAGVVPVTVTLEQDWGEGGGCGPAFQGEGGPKFGEWLFSGPSNLVLTPHVAPVAPTIVNAETPQDTPAPLSISVPTLTDDSESIAIFISGLPAGGSLNHGTNLGGGRWQLTVEDLKGLFFIPPPGGFGTFSLTVQVVVTDVGDELPPPPPPPPDDGGCQTFVSFAFASVEGEEGFSVAPVTATTNTTLTVTVTSPSLPPPVSPPTVPPTILPPSPPPDLGGVSTSIVVESSNVVTVDTTTPTTSTSTATIASETAAAFGMIPGVEVNNEYAADKTPSESALPALGSPSAAAASASSSFAAGREKHPLQPIQALEHDSATTLFEGSGDSIPLIEQLYKDAAPPQPNDVDPKSKTEPSTSAIPFGPIELAPVHVPAAAAVAVAGIEVITAGDERIAADGSNDPSEVTGSIWNWQTGLMLGLLPLLSSMLMTDGRSTPLPVRRWLRHLFFKPCPREGVS